MPTLPKSKLGFWPVPGKAHTYYFGYKENAPKVTGEGEFVPAPPTADEFFDSLEYKELGHGDA